MADVKITALGVLTAADPINDAIPIVDVSDNSMAASGTTKRISVNNILGASGTATLASATISGDLTVATNRLVVNASGVCIGTTTATPFAGNTKAVVGGGSGAIGLTLYGGVANTTGLYYADGIVGNETYRGYLEYSHATDSFAFGTAGVNRYTIDSTGVSTWSVGGSTAMTLNSTGLGVGVASPDFKFVVNGTQAVPSTSGSSATDGSLRIGAPGTGLVIDTGVTAASAVYGWIQARLRTDYSSNFNLVLQPNGGNVGIGVTPSAWGTGNKFIDINSSAAFGAFGASDAMMIGNAYWDGSSWIRKTANNAWRFVIESVSSSPSMTWQLAANGSAGSSILSWTQAMTLNASGNLLVARTGAGLDNTSGVTIGQASIGMQTEGNATQIVVNRTTSDGTIVDLRRNNSSVGNISVTTSGATFNSTSDYRLKESVAPLSGGLARVNALKPSIYKWKSDGSDGEGFLAHELAEVVPLAVTGEKDAVNEDGSIKPQGVDLSRVVPILVAAIQELTAEVNALKNA